MQERSTPAFSTLGYAPAFSAPPSLTPIWPNRTVCRFLPQNTPVKMIIGIEYLGSKRCSTFYISPTLHLHEENQNNQNKLTILVLH